MLKISSPNKLVTGEQLITEIWMSLEQLYGQVGGQRNTVQTQCVERRGGGGGGRQVGGQRNTVQTQCVERRGGGVRQVGGQRGTAQTQCVERRGGGEGG